MPFQSTLIKPHESAAPQVEAQRSGLAPLDIMRYYTKNEYSRVVGMYLNLEGAERDAYMRETAKGLLIKALVNEHKLPAIQSKEFVELMIQKPEFDPERSVTRDGLEPFGKYLEDAYTQIQVEYLKVCMDVMNRVHAVYVPVEKLDYLPIDEVLDFVKHPEREVTQEYAESLFVRDPMRMFAEMYARSVLMVHDLVQLPDQKEMMKPMYYQLWKMIILNPGERDPQIDNGPGSMGIAKTMKKSVQGVSV